MSVLVSTWVWKHSRARGAQLIVLLYLADKADDDGCNRWPRSIERMARECRLSERGLQNALKLLRNSGQIRIVGKSEAGVVAYQVVMDGGAQTAPGTSTDGGGASEVGGSSEAVVRDVLGAPRAGVQNLHPPESDHSLRVLDDGRKACTRCGTILVADATSCELCEAFK